MGIIAHTLKSEIFRNNGMNTDDIKFENVEINKNQINNK